ncbi:MAG: hypothetical protein U9M89_02865 [Patescibacteria group bacterium]|nr:hypothetical protein [Patescibacteria group bacterium]
MFSALMSLLGGAASFLPSTAAGWGSLMGGIGQAGQFGMGLASALSGDGANERARHIWERSRDETQQMLQSSTYAPWAEGMGIPYAGAQWQNGMDPSMQNVYQQFLERDYGLPAEVALANQSQAVAPMRINRQAMSSVGTPGQMSRATQVNPQALAQGFAGINQSSNIAQQDYLKNAAKIASLGSYQAERFKNIYG